MGSRGSMTQWPDEWTTVPSVIAVSSFGETARPDDTKVAVAITSTVKSRVVCKSERKLLDASVRLPWRPPSVREA